MSVPSHSQAENIESWRSSRPWDTVLPICYSINQRIYIYLKSRMKEVSDEQASFLLGLLDYEERTSIAKTKITTKSKFEVINRIRSPSKRCDHIKLAFMLYPFTVWSRKFFRWRGFWVILMWRRGRGALAMEIWEYLVNISLPLIVQ